MKADDLGEYYRVPMDQRSLNYDKYFIDGEEHPTDAEYNSDNTYRLNVEEIKERLANLFEIQEELSRFQ